MERTLPMQVVFRDKRYDLDNRDQRIAYAMVRWAPFIERMSRNYENSVADREDFTQEAMMAIVRAADAYDPSRGRFETFMYSCIRNQILDASARTRYVASIPSGSAKDADLRSLSPVRLSDEVPDQDSEGMYEAIDLTEGLRHFDRNRMGMMYFVEGYTMQEIADSVGCSLSTVSRVINQIRDRMQVLCKDVYS